MCKLAEFFEDADERLSMTRLLMFLSFVPSSYVVVVNGNEGMLGWYIGGYVLGYVGGKGFDTFGGRNANQTNTIRGGSPYDDGDGVEGSGLEREGRKAGSSRKRPF